MDTLTSTTATKMIIIKIDNKTLEPNKINSNDSKIISGESSNMNGRIW